MQNYAIASLKCVKKICSCNSSVPNVSRCTAITTWILPHSLVFSTRYTWKSPVVWHSVPSKRHSPVDNNKDKWGQQPQGSHTQKNIQLLLWISRQGLPFQLADHQEQERLSKLLHWWPQDDRFYYPTPTLAHSLWFHLLIDPRNKIAAKSSPANR